ncbi:MAG: nucleotide pyrophosphohydrolase [Candidatus Hodarchaeota archaeon]
MVSNRIDDNNTTISYFKKDVDKFVEERSWKKYHTPKNLIQALGIEVAELSEIFLFRDYDIEKIHEDNKLMENISDEIADIFIYLLSLVNCLNIDLTKIFIRKMEKNRKKYSHREFNNGSFYKK